MRSSEQKEKNSPKEKPKYNMWQNAWFMIKLAWREKEKKVLVLGMITALLAVATSLINLYISPMVLACVEQGASVARLAITILVFTGLLVVTSAASAYVGANIVFGRITVRSAIIAASTARRRRPPTPTSGTRGSASSSPSPPRQFRATTAPPKPYGQRLVSLQRMSWALRFILHCFRPYSQQ